VEGRTPEPLSPSCLAGTLEAAATAGIQRNTRRKYIVVATWKGLIIKQTSDQLLMVWTCCFILSTARDYM
jgi:hypothetical protein